MARFQGIPVDDPTTLPPAPAPRAPRFRGTPIDAPPQPVAADPLDERLPGFRTLTRRDEADLRDRMGISAGPRQAPMPAPLVDAELPREEITPDANEINRVQAETPRQEITPAPGRGLIREALRFNQDLGASIVSGVGSVVQFPGQVQGLLTGDWDNASMRAGDAVRRFAQSGMSPELLEKQRQAQEVIRAAEQEGFGAEVRAVLGTYLSDPALLANFTVEQLPSLLGTLGGGKLAQWGTQFLARGRASAPALSRAGQVGAIGTGAAMQGASVGDEARNAVLQLPPETFAAAPAYQALVAAGVDPETAKQQLAQQAARLAGSIGGAISLGTAALLPGVERMAFGQTTAGQGIIRRVLTGGTAEFAQEGLEEGGGRAAQNFAVQQIDPNQSIMQGVGAQGTMGALPGAVMGGGVAALSGGDAPAAPPAPQPAPPTGGPRQEPYFGTQPPAPPTAPVPPMPGPSAGDLRDLIADPRPLDQILAERRAADEARRTELVNRYGLPAIGQSFAFEQPGAEPLSGRLEDVTEQDGQAIARIRGSDGQVYALRPGEFRVLDGDGTREAPVRVEAPQDVDRAAQRAEQPTPAQAEAGNYRQGHLEWQGFDIAIETPRGGVRSGVDPDGVPWSVRMPNHYGRIKGTKGADGDQLDIYVGPNTDWQSVLVIDQIDPRTGKFDEHKIMAGFDMEELAEEAYTRAFSDGSGLSRIGATTSLSLDELRTWIANGDTTKPLSYKGEPKYREVVREDRTPKPNDNYRGGIAAPPFQIPASPSRAPASPGAAPAAEGPAPVVAQAPASFIPTREDFLAALPKDENGEPDSLQAASRVLQKVIGRLGADWNTLTDAQKIEAVALARDERYIPPKRPNAAPASNAPRDLDMDRRAFKGALEKTGAAQYGGADYVIAEASNGGFYFRRTKDGNRVEKGGGYPAKWSREEAIRRATLEAFSGAQSAPQAAEPVTLEIKSLETGKTTELRVPAAPAPRSTPESITKPPPAQNGHFAAGRNAAGRGEPRTLPSYFTDRNGANARWWLRGWDSVQAVQQRPTATPETIAKPAAPPVIDDRERQRQENIRKARENQENALREEAAKAAGTTFKTAKGSTYRVEADGTTTRDKAYRKEHGAAEQGPQPKSDLTFYVTAEQAEALSWFQTEGNGSKAIVGLSDGKFGVEYRDGKDAGKVERRTVVTPKATPAVGLLPVEIWRDGARVHFGNEIVSVTPAPTVRANSGNSAQNQQKTEQNQSPDRARQDAAPVTQPQPPKAAAQPAEKPAETSNWGASNKLVTADRAAELREKLKAKLRGQLSSGIDPEMMAMGAELAVFHVEAGARKFADFARKIAGDLGASVESLKPYLRAWYNGARDMMEDRGLDVADMDPADKVKAELDRVIAGEANATVEEPEATEAADPDQEPDAEPVEDEEAPAATQKPFEGDSDNARLVRAFMNALIEGRKFPSIAQAREIAKPIVGRIEPGTPLAKTVDEAFEVAVVQAARAIVADGRENKQPPTEIYEKLVDLYNRQPPLNVRTSTSVANQAYSTPVPLAFLASELAGIGPETMVYEPTAGNGALLIGVENPRNAFANELNAERAAALREQGFRVTSVDAAEPAQGRVLRANDDVDAVIANPPFGVVRGDDQQSKVWKIDDRYQTTEIDHAISLRSLAAIPDNGKAVLIIGGIAKTATSQEARSEAYRGKAKVQFYLTLYRQYNVIDHFTVAGELYERQGAGWPVDVIVIDGRRKSERKIPSVDVPVVFRSWEDLKEKFGAAPRTALEAPGQVREPDGGNVVGGTQGSDERPGAAPGRSGDRGDGGRAPGQNELLAGGRPDATGDARLPELPAAAAEPGSDQERGRADRSPDAAAQPRVAAPRADKPAEVETNLQVAYAPASAGEPLGTLAPVNMRDAITSALDSLKARVGDIDAFVADRLGYKDNILDKYFAAEQVDAIALGLDNFDRGRGFIIGDQTGIGKGRVVAAMIRYAIRQGAVPVFVTEKPGLYADMFRDMNDIGIKEMLGRDVRALMTNAAERVPLDDEGKAFLESPSAGKHNADLARFGAEPDVGGHDVVFTTYSQMQTVKGKITPRMAFLEAIAPRSIVIFDESHNAGGQGPDTQKKPGAPPNRAEFARILVGKAKAVFYSSATYAKRPDVMDLYSKTDMPIAVDGDVKKLSAAIEKGGVPLQQAVATMLARAGQYVRRERSFDGVSYDVQPVNVDIDTYKQFSKLLGDINSYYENFIEPAKGALDEEVKAEGESVGHDNATGTAGVESTSFSSGLHNIISQMLLSLKADQAAEQAIAAAKRDEKPVITLANTMGAFLKDYAEETNTSPGQALKISMADVMLKQIDRQRHYTIKKPWSNEPAKRGILTDAQIGPRGLAAEKALKDFIKQSRLDRLPASPIDWIHKRLNDAGLKSGEITGRKEALTYEADGTVRYRIRPSKDTKTAGKRAMIAEFNDGRMDVMILNQSGSTGISLHASERFKDQRKRTMIIAQAEANIDTHMQMLGRVHRTGQVVKPAYIQLIANVPAEKRPAAVLQKKMASLNANTTASRSSALTAKDVPDFMNQYGDKVAVSVMAENHDLHRALGEPLKFGDDDKVEGEGAMRKVTGRIPMLPLEQQETLYSILEAEYEALIAQLDAMGENALEAKTMALDAKLEKKIEAVKSKGGTSPFAQGVDAEIVDVKRLGRPFKSSQVIEQIADALGVDRPTDEDPIAALRRLTGPAEAAMEKTRVEALERFSDYQREVLDDMREGPAKEQAGVRFNDQQARFTRLMDLLYVGATVRLENDKGNFYAVVTKITPPDGTKVKNPLALGSWKVQFAMADAARQMVVPMSQLEHADQKTTRENTVMVRPMSAIGDLPIIRAFDQMQGDRREKRAIFTGNMLAAVDLVKGRGQIVNYQTDDGQTKTGILMSRDFDVSKFLSEQAVPLGTGGQVMRFIERSGETAFSSDEAIEVAPLPNGNARISVARAKALGGKYFLDREVLRAAGRDFVLAGQKMRVDLNPVQAEQVVDAMRNVGAKFEARSGHSVAKAIRGDKSSSGDRFQLLRSDGDGSPRRRRPTSSAPMTERSLDARREDVFAALREALDEIGLSDVSLAVPDRLFAGRMADGRAAEAAGRFRTWGWTRPLIEIALTGGGRMRAADEQMSTLYHEAIHALKAMRLFSPAEWKVLSERSEKVWIKEHGLDDRALYKDMPKALRIEEGVAFAFQEWMEGRGDPPTGGLIARAFRKLKRFFEALRNALMGRGFRTVEGIFEDVESGQVGRRGRIAANALQDGPRKNYDPMYSLLGSDKVPVGETERMAEQADTDILKGDTTPFVKDIGLFKTWMVHPRTIAAFDKHFVPVYRAAVRQFETRDQLAAEIARAAQPYMDLGPDDKAAVNRVLELGRLEGTTYGADQLREGVANDPDQNEGRTKAAELSRPGQTIKLTDRQIEGYRAVRKSMDLALDLFKQQVIREWGYDPNEVKDSADLQEMAREADGKEAERHNAAAQIVREIEQAQRTGYVPFTRWGQVAIAVRKEDETQMSLGLDGAPQRTYRTVHYEQVEVESPVNRLVRFTRRLRKRETAEQLGNLPEVKERLAALKKQYGDDPSIQIRVFQVGEGGPVEQQVRLSDVDMLAELGRVNDETWEKVREQLEIAQKMRSFRKHFFGAKNTPGYSVDFERAIADYTIGIAGYLARRQYGPIWDGAIGKIPTTKPKLREYAQNYRTYTQSPQEELQMLRQAGFIWYLAGSPATAAVNLSQVPLVSVPYLSQFANPALVSLEITKANKDAALMATASQGFDIFDPAKAPADVREAFQVAWDEGFFVPLNTWELMGTSTNRSKALRKLSKASRTTVDAVALMFTTAERLNRIVTWLAAYRLAQRANVVSRVRDTLANNALARSDELLRGFTPEKFAGFVVDETQLRMGKVNRPTIMRGPGTALLQFKGFVMQMLELQFRMAAQHKGPRSKAALAAFLLMLMMVAGVWGFPFAEDVRDAYEALHKKLRGIDIDLETELRELVYELTGSPRIAEAVSTGAPRAAGVDLQRIGMGNILPGNAQEAGGIPLDITIGRLSKATEDGKRGDWLQAVGEVLPNFLKNPLDAASWATEGVKSQATGRVVIPPEQVKTSDVAMKALGFTPADVANRREAERAKTRANTATREVKDQFLLRLAQLQADIVRAGRENKTDEANRLMARYQRTIEEIAEFNEGRPTHEQVLIRPETLRQRIREELLGAEAKDRRAPRQARERRRELETIFGVEK